MKRLPPLAVPATIVVFLLAGCATTAPPGEPRGFGGSAPTAPAGSATSAPAGSDPVEPGGSSSGSPSAAARPGRHTALAVVAALPVKGRAPMTGYDRDRFGSAWSDDVDVDDGHNGCDTRNDVLQRDLTRKSYKAGTRDCVVTSGDLPDPYSGETIHFRRGERTSAAVQIDHVVALADAWATGAQQLSAAQREDLANDPGNLLAVDGRLNNQKSASDAASWLPPVKAYRCRYVARQVAVKTRYGLWVTSAEKAAIVRILRGCPGQPTPAVGPRIAASADDSGGSGGAAESGRAAGAGSERGSGSRASDSSRPRHSGSGGGSGSRRHYRNCSAVRAAGAAPLHRGDPGYSGKLDRDGDGVACE